MSTETEQSVHSREDCLEAAAEALARCYQGLIEQRGNTTAPAEARAV